MKIQPLKLGTACAITGVLLYLGCVGLMVILGPEGTVWFFNSILHGFDVSHSIRMDVPFVDSVAGLGLTGIIGFVSGWSVAMIYNKLT